MERFYDVSNGEVLYLGHDVRSLNVGWYRRQLAYVGQEPTLFNMTIAENIAFGADGVSRADIEAAARQVRCSSGVSVRLVLAVCRPPLTSRFLLKANAHDFIMEFPQAYDTPVGASKANTGLSGGQKQRYVHVSVGLLIVWAHILTRPFSHFCVLLGLQLLERWSASLRS